MSYAVFLIALAFILIIVIVLTGYYLFEKRFDFIKMNYTTKLKKKIDDLNESNYNVYSDDVQQNEHLDVTTRRILDLERKENEQVAMMNENLNQLNKFKSNNETNIKSNFMVLEDRNSLSLKNSIANMNSTIQQYQGDVSDVQNTVSAFSVPKQQAIINDISYKLNTLSNNTATAQDNMTSLLDMNATNHKNILTIMSTANVDMQNYAKASDLSELQNSVDATYNRKLDFNQNFQAPLNAFENSVDNMVLNSELTKYAPLSDVQANLDTLVHQNDLNNFVLKNDLMNYAPNTLLKNLAMSNMIDQNYISKLNFNPQFNVSDSNLRRINNDLVHLSDEYGTRTISQTLFNLMDNITTSAQNIQETVTTVATNYVPNSSLLTEQNIESASLHSLCNIVSIQDKLGVAWANMSNVHEKYISNSLAASMYTTNADFTNLAQNYAAYPTVDDMIIQFNELYGPYEGLKAMKNEIDQFPNFDEIFAKRSSMDALSLKTKVVADSMSNIIDDLSGMYGQHTYQYGKKIQGIDANAGKTGYHALSRNSLDIVGGGVSASNRLVNIYDNMNVSGNIKIGQICLAGRCTPSPHPGPDGRRGDQGGQGDVGKQGIQGPQGDTPGDNSYPANWSWLNNTLTTDSVLHGNFISAQRINLGKNSRLCFGGTCVGAPDLRNWKQAFG